MTAFPWLRRPRVFDPTKTTSALFRREGGFTLVEVVVSIGMIVSGLAGVYALQAHTLQITRAARDSSSASQVLQQRVEQLRMTPFEEFTTSAGLTSLMQGDAGATQSEREMTGVRNVRETVAISTYARPGVTPAPPVQTLSVTRSGGAATASAAGATLAGESQVKARLLVTWDDRAGRHRREFTTVFSKGGLSIDGITPRVERSSTPYVGGGAPPAEPTPATPAPVPATPPPVAATPAPNPIVCRHGRAWPHCGQQ